MTAAGRRRAALRQQPLPALDHALEAARFAAVYPGVPYVSLAYPTRDHIIPARLFDVFYRRLPVALALQRLNAGAGVRVGAQLSTGTEPTADMAEAFPEGKP